jgi:t-SNARE complex subunit (syntaxin)
MSKGNNKTILAEQQRYEAEMEKLRENWSTLTEHVALINQMLGELRSVSNAPTAKPN